MLLILHFLGLAVFVEGGLDRGETNTRRHRREQCGHGPTTGDARRALKALVPAPEHSEESAQIGLSALAPSPRSLSSCFFNEDPVLVQFPSLNTVFEDDSIQECDICGGPGGKPLPEVNQRITVDDAAVQECLQAAEQGTVAQEFCDLLVFLDLFTCGDLQTNPAVFGPFCPGFQNTLGVDCDCNTLNLAAPPPPVPEEPVVVPGAADAPVESEPENSAGFLQRIKDFIATFLG